MNKINLAIVTGGHAAEKEISLKSANVVFNNIDKQKYNTFLVDISTMPWTATKENNVYNVDFQTFEIVELQVKFDVAFIAIHGTPAEDGKLQGYFDLLNIPYSACSVLASAITFDKDITKKLIEGLGPKMAKSALITTTDFNLDEITEKLSLPLFVKPNKNGSSYGVSKIKNYNDLEAAIKHALKYDDEVLVEEFVNGSEIASGVLERNGKLICLPLTEIKTTNEFFDYEAKYLGKSEELTPAPIAKELTLKCQEYTKKIYRKLKLSGAVRIDYFLVEDDFYILEVNTIPGLSEESILPQQAKAYGFTLSEFFDIILTEAIKKNQNGNFN
ncbi:MAG: D-alanine--D-alanine ligase [Chitinophagales bacterium]